MVSIALYKGRKSIYNDLTHQENDMKRLFTNIFRCDRLGRLIYACVTLNTFVSHDIHISLFMLN